MKKEPRFTPRFALTAASVLVVSLVGALPGFAQDDQSAPPPPPSTQSGGWRKFQPPADQQNAPPDAQQGQPSDANPFPAGPGDPQDQPPGPPPGTYQQGPPPQGSYQQAPAPHYAPTTITMPPGTWVTVRVNEPLSSDHNQTGDAFTGTLLEPIVSNGLLIARRGATVSGIVTEAQKAGRVSGVSHLKLELTGIQLSNGHQIQVKTRLIDRRGETSHGRDAFAIGATTATGAAIGAGVNGGVGAGVGAAAGLVVSTIGVLLTRGRPTVVYPETPLTFSTQTALVLDNSQQAFQYAQQQDYNARVARPPAPRPGYGPGVYGAPRPNFGEDVAKDIGDRKNNIAPLKRKGPTAVIFCPTRLEISRITTKVWTRRS